MTRAQRLAISLGLIFTAAVLHLSLCDWTPRGNTGVSQTGSGRINTRIYLISRITNRYGIDPPVAVLFGLATPALLMTAAAALVFGWKRSVRLEHGFCLRCGYDLRYKYEAGCSECGWRRASL